MDLFTRQDLRGLLETSSPCVSLYMPTTRGVALQDRKSWKNLVKDAQERLVARGQRSPEARDLLAPAQALLDDATFWRNVSEGLAGFLSPGRTSFYRLPVPFREQVAAGERFHITPLLAHLGRDGRFHVLALSQKNVRLLLGTRQTLREVDLPGVPTSSAEALSYPPINTRTEPRPPGRPAGKGEVAPHGQHGEGSSVQGPKDNLLPYLQRVDTGLQPILQREGLPLVLAAAEPLLSIYRRANSYHNLLPDAIEGHPDRLGDR